jgi:hypothetical protein
VVVVVVVVVGDGRRHFAASLAKLFGYQEKGVGVEVLRRHLATDAAPEGYEGLCMIVIDDADDDDDDD